MKENFNLLSKIVSRISIRSWEEWVEGFQIYLIRSYTIQNLGSQIKKSNNFFDNFFLITDWKLFI